MKNSVCGEWNRRMYLLPLSDSLRIPALYHFTLRSPSFSYTLRVQTSKSNMIYFSFLLVADNFTTVLHTQQTMELGAVCDNCPFLKISIRIDCFCPIEFGGTLAGQCQCAVQNISPITPPATPQSAMVKNPKFPLGFVIIFRTWIFL